MIPFIRPISPTLTPTEKISLVTRDDHWRFLIYDQTHKIDNAESFRFFQHPVKFIAIATDSSGVISSLVIYVENEGCLMQQLITEFGVPTSSSEISYKVADPEKHSVKYETVGWETGGYFMLFAERPYSVNSPKHLLSRIFIKKLNRKF